MPAILNRSTGGFVSAWADHARSVLLILCNWRRAGEIPAFAVERVPAVLFALSPRGKFSISRRT